LLVNELATGEDLLNLLNNLSREEATPSLELINRQISEIKTMCSKAREAWAFAVFSDQSKEILERYFTFHLQVLTRLSKEVALLPEILLPACTCIPSETVNGMLEDEINTLLDHLFEYFGDYPNKNLNTSLSYNYHILKVLMPDIDITKSLLENIDLPALLKESVVTYVHHLSDVASSYPVTYTELFYFQRFIKELKRFFKNAASSDLNRSFANKLLDLEFNHVEVFTWLQQDLVSFLKGKRDKEKLFLMKKRAEMLRFSTDEKKERYKSNWHPLSFSLAEWLASEIAELKASAPPSQSFFQRIEHRFKLEMPEAHIACLVRMLKKEKRLENIPLTEVFQFISDNFCTTRAVKLSPGGISKEYYSINQVTAAEVRDMLQKMVARINRDFFPVMAAAGILIHVCLNK
jgi:hypothetical protein